MVASVKESVTFIGRISVHSRFSLLIFQENLLKVDDQMSF